MCCVPDGHFGGLLGQAGQEESTFRSVYGDVSYTLPHVAEIETQFYSAGLLDALGGKAAKAYNAEIKKIAGEVFRLE